MRALEHRVLLCARARRVGIVRLGTVDQQQQQHPQSGVVRSLEGAHGLARLLVLPCQSIVSEDDCDLEVLLPDEGGFLGFGAITDEDIAKRVMQSKVRVNRVMQLLNKAPSPVPSLPLPPPLHGRTSTTSPTTP